MRKVGVVTSGIGLIFYGFSLIIYNFNNELGIRILGFWPAIIIILGLEILFYNRKKTEETKMKFNFAIILLVILFLITSGYVNIKSKLNISNKNSRGIYIDLPFFNENNSD